MPEFRLTRLGRAMTVEGPVQEDGMVFDFMELKRIVEERVLSKVDHSYLNDIFEQPTAENIRREAANVRKRAKAEAEREK